MATALIWIAAYLVSGFIYVARNLRQPLKNQPGYLATRRGRWTASVLWVFLTLSLILMMTTHGFGRAGTKYILGEALPSWGVFIALGIVGTWYVSG